VVTIPPIWSMTILEVITSPPPSGLWGHSGSVPSKQSCMIKSAGRRTAVGGSFDAISACVRINRISTGSVVRWIISPLPPVPIKPPCLVKAFVPDREPSRICITLLTASQPLSPPQMGKSSSTSMTHSAFVERSKLHRNASAMCKYWLE